MEVIHDLDVEGKLKIYQDTDLNSFTFDSVLLSYFTNLRKKDNLIVDLCSGNAPIAMFLTLKKEDLKISCVEIQKEVCELAKKSISINSLEDKIEVYCADLKGISKEIGANKYDVITCNPPYFRVDEDSNLNISDSISIARHEISVNLKDIIIESRKLLNNTGSLNFVYRPDRIDELIILLNENNFYINRLHFVYPKISKGANTVLVEARKGKVKNNKIKVLKPIVVYNENSNYTDDAKTILKIIKE